jgi:hypothetical protein
MLPASRKPRLANWLAYPIGYEVLRAALEGVPMFERLRLRFLPETYNRRVPFRQVIDSQVPHCILSARFERATKLCDEDWSVTVYPVSRPTKAKAKTALVSNALPGIHRWFSQEHPPSWLWGGKYCNVIFDPLDGSIRLEEGIENI